MRGKCKLDCIISLFRNLKKLLVHIHVSILQWLLNHTNTLQFMVHLRVHCHRWLSIWSFPVSVLFIISWSQLTSSWFLWRHPLALKNLFLTWLLFKNSFSFSFWLVEILFHGFVDSLIIFCIASQTFGWDQV